MKVTVLVSDKRTAFGTSNREFWSYLSAYKYVKSHLDRVISVKIKIVGGEITYTLQEFIDFINLAG